MLLLHLKLTSLNSNLCHKFHWIQFVSSYSLVVFTISFHLPLPLLSFLINYWRTSVFFPEAAICRQYILERDGWNSFLGKQKFFLRVWVFPKGLFSFYFSPSRGKRQMLDFWLCKSLYGDSSPCICRWSLLINVSSTSCNKTESKEAPTTMIQCHRNKIQFLYFRLSLSTWF